MLIRKSLHLGGKNRIVSSISMFTENLRKRFSAHEPLHIYKRCLPQSWKRHLHLTVEHSGLMSHVLKAMLESIGLKQTAVVCMKRKCDYRYPHFNIFFLHAERNARTAL